MVTAPLDVSVVIRTYTEARWDFLVAAVESIARQTAPPRELVLVVDHNPALLDRVRERFPWAVVVENHGLRGSSEAWNSGVVASRGQIIAFLDDDAQAAPDWLERLWPEYADQAVVGVGGLIRPLWAGGARPKWFPEEFDWVLGCTYRGMATARGQIRNLIGCNMSCRRRVFEQIGGFRTDMGHVGGRPMGNEETEFFIRLGQRAPGSILIHQPEAWVTHHVPASRATWRYFLFRCRLEGRSKARTARVVGKQDGLSSERGYVRKALPAGVWRGIRDAVQGRDPAGLARAGAIVSGLGVTTASYLWGTIEEALMQRPSIGRVPQIAPIAPTAEEGMR